MSKHRKLRKKMQKKHSKEKFKEESYYNKFIFLIIWGYHLTWCFSSIQHHRHAENQRVEWPWDSLLWSFLLHLFKQPFLSHRSRINSEWSMCCTTSKWWYHCTGQGHRPCHSLALSFIKLPYTLDACSYGPDTLSKICFFFLPPTLVQVFVPMLILDP